VGDVARHLLRADQHALDLRIVHGRKVRPRADVHREARTCKQLDRRVLQRAFRDAQAKDRGRGTRDGGRRAKGAHAISRKKHERAPVWQTLPSPSRFTFTSTVSSSQSERSEVTCRRLPEVSPLVQSSLRERLKKVTKPLSRVRASASSFMKPTIRT